ncbi:MAG: hypothetical protein N2517_08980 [Ignavibacteria bacterium]|nr:hypothetical protein [Ignavibacteria bacterium]
MNDACVTILAGKMPALPFGEARMLLLLLGAQASQPVRTEVATASLPSKLQKQGYFRYFAGCKSISAFGIMFF